MGENYSCGSIDGGSDGRRMNVFLLRCWEREEGVDEIFMRWGDKIT